MAHPITVRLPDEEIEKLDEIARETERKRSWHMTRAIRLYIKDEHAFLEGVRIGDQAADRGEMIFHEEVEAGLDALLAEKNS